jgi:glutaredoxin
VCLGIPGRLAINLSGKGVPAVLELFVKDGCPYCRKQMEQLDKEGVSYRLRNVSRDQAALKELREKYGASIVPVLVEDGKVKSMGYQGMG